MLHSFHRLGTNNDRFSERTVCNHSVHSPRKSQNGLNLLKFLKKFFKIVPLLKVVDVLLNLYPSSWALRVHKVCKKFDCSKYIIK